MRITRVYTRAGDGGQTRLVGGLQVPKDHPRIEAYGTVDELNAIVGLVRAHLPSELDEMDRQLEEIQSDLFNVGTDLATPIESRWAGMYEVGDDDVKRLETWIDAWNAELAPLKEFILPGGGITGAFLHQARTVCRRAERRAITLGREERVQDGCVRYLNRLSDYFFVAGRAAAAALGEPEPTWKNPNTRKKPE